MSQRGSHPGRLVNDMDRPALERLNADVSAGTCSVDEAVRQLRRFPFADLGFARVDHHRDLRQGLPEAIFGPGKTPEHCAAIVEELLAATTGPVLLTSATADQVKAVSASSEPLGQGAGDITAAGPLWTMTFRSA